MTSSNIYKYSRGDMARCVGNPEHEECNRCARKASAQESSQGWWIGPWVGHGPCPDSRFRPKEDARREVGA